MFGSKRKTTSHQFTGEPPRTPDDPPPGYQTPSPDQPYGIGQEKVIAADVGDHMEPAVEE